MNVGSTKEKNPEKRISITPDTSKSLKGLGLNVFLEKGYGESLGFKDQQYIAVSYTHLTLPTTERV